MLHRSLSDRQLVDVHRQLMRRGGSIAFRGLAGGGEIGIGHTLELWRVDLDRLDQHEQDLRSIARPIGHWVQIVRGGQSQESAVVDVFDKERDDLALVTGVSVSILASDVDQAISSLYREGGDLSEIRLLEVKPLHISAIWLRTHSTSKVVIVAAPHRRQGWVRDKEYSEIEFLERLRDIGPISGVLARTGRREARRMSMATPPSSAGQAPRTRLVTVLARRYWAFYTLLYLALLAGCGIWAANVPSATSGSDLSAPWLAVEILLLLGYGLLGSATVGRFDGILINDVNRISLARFQWVVWITIILGGYYVESMWNLAHAIAPPPLSADLLKLLGLVTGSSVVAGVIMDSKKNAPVNYPRSAQLLSSALPDPQPPPGASTHIGAVDRNVGPEDASWSDLYIGDEVETRNVVDVSRLQKLITTVMLTTSCSSMLLQQLAHVDIGGGAQMPALDTGFVWMLGLSHGGYLAYKAVPKSSVG